MYFDYKLFYNGYDNSYELINQFLNQQYRLQLTYIFDC
nr:hypothetical protein CJLB15_00118 [Campylobacter phage CJLB-15]